MFELTITNNKKSEFLIKPSTRRGFDPSLHETIEFDNNLLSVCGLSYKGKQIDQFENEQYLVLICGLVYNRLCNSKDLYPITSAEVLNKYISVGISYLDNIKGNFIIVIYNKHANTFDLAKDQLGLKYLYYKTEGSNFYISTNLNDFRRLPHSYNTSVILEKLMFTYPIGNESYIEGVFSLEQGSLLTFDNSRIRIKSYFNIEDIFSSKDKLERFNKKYFLKLFEKSVLQRANASTKINVALTGGFDGRSIVAALLKDKRDFLAYSFGKQGGENTKVPLNVSNKLDLNYIPIFLDEDYEKSYKNCAMDAIYFSDGISIFERANYIFALNKLALRSKYNLTGLIGGEVLAPIHMLTDYINEPYYNIIYNETDFDIKDILLNSGLSKYINLNMISSDIETKLKRNIQLRRNQIQTWKNNRYGWMYYLKDLASLGFQRFYGNQMHLERYFNENLTPFYDLDLLKYIYSTNHINVYKKAFISSPFVRRNNRKLQTVIIKNFSHALGEIPVDRGYPPNYNLDIRKLFIPYQYYKRKRCLKDAPPDFLSPVWNSNLFKSLDLKITDESKSELFDLDEINAFLIDYNPEKHNIKFNHMLSILIWITNRF